MSEDKALVPIDQAPLTLRAMGKMIGTPAIPDRYNNWREAMAAVYVGRELGLAPLESINNLYLVDGRVSLSGKTMLALVLRAGHRIHIDLNDERAVVTGYRWDENKSEYWEVGTFTFNMADAKRAGVLGKPAWIAYPATMMGWRAVSQMCKLAFADVLSGHAHMPEEFGIETPVEVLPIGDEDLENATSLVIDEFDATVVDAEVVDLDAVDD